MIYREGIRNEGMAKRVKRHFDIFKVRTPLYIQNDTLISNDTFFIIYIKEYFWTYQIKSITHFLIFLYFSNLNLKYLKFSKMGLTRFAMKLFIYKWKYLHNNLHNICKMGKPVECILLTQL